MLKNPAFVFLLLLLICITQWIRARAGDSQTGSINL